MKKYIHVYIIVVAIALFSPMLVLADDGPTQLGEVDGAPIDGGLSLLIVTGAGYGLKKLKERKAVAKLQGGQVEK